MRSCTPVAWNSVLKLGCYSCTPCFSSSKSENGVLGVHLSGSQNYRNRSVLNWDCRMDDDIIHLPVRPNPSNCLFWLLQCLHISPWIYCDTSSLSWKMLVMAVMACTPSRSLQSRFINLHLPSLRPPEGCAPRTLFYWRQGAETARVMRSGVSAEFHAYSVSRENREFVLVMETFWKSSVNFVKDVPIIHVTISL